jgi:hypothetical protein
VNAGVRHVEQSSSARETDFISCSNQQYLDVTHHEKEFSQQKKKISSEPQRLVRQTVVTMKENLSPFCLAFCATGIG